MFRRCLTVVCIYVAVVGVPGAASAQDDDLDSLFEESAEPQGEPKSKPSADAPESESADQPETSAQTPPPVETVPVKELAAPAKPAPKRREVEEIVVTAQKREQRLVDVPINVSALSGEDLRNTKIEQVRDIAGYLPNVDIKEQVPGAIPVVTIRGVGLDDFSSTNSPAAGIYVDQVTLSSLALMSFDLYDMERVEVLKGPQGTLYGRNSTAGAINVLTARPKDEMEGYLKVGYGEYEAGELEGMFNVPVVDNFALRFAGKVVRQNEGFWNSRSSETSGGGSGGGPLPPAGGTGDTSNDPVVRTVGLRNIASGRVRALWNVTDNLSVDLKLDGLQQRSQMGQPEMWGALCESGFTPIDPDHCTDASGYSDRDRDPYKGDWAGDFPYNIDQQGATALVDWDLGWASVASVTGVIDFERFFHIDVDGQPKNMFNFLQADDVKQLSQELRLAGTTGPVDWLVGGFYAKDDVLIDTEGRHQDLIPDEKSHITVDQATEGSAGFVNLDWHLSPLFTLVGGYRYSTETRHYVGGSDWTVEVQGTIEDTFIDRTIKDSSDSWRAGVNFTPGEDTLLYLSASKGVKSGGFFAGVTTANRQLEPYLPEELLAYELGAKWQGAVTLNGSLFYYDYTNVQVFMRDGSAPVQFIGNVSKAEVYGADLDFMWLPLDNLTFQSGVGLLRTQLGAFIGPDGTDIPEGNTLANAPAITANALARYELPVFSTGLNSAFQVDAHYSDSVFKEATNDPLISADEYRIFNARMSLLPTTGNWELALWGRNLTDELYVVQGLDVAVLFFGNRNYNAPRSAGLELNMRF